MLGDEAQPEVAIEDVPKISLVTSVYGAEDYIEQLMEDVTRQTIFKEKCEWVILNANPEGHNTEEEVILNYIEKYPNLPEFRYWYLVNLGSWAQVYGILTAAREGVSELMKMHSEKIIELDPTYRNGGGYFMLGAVHYKSPYIPYFLSWPNNDEAIKYLQLALETGKATLNQKVYLAKALKKDNQIDKTKKLLLEVINSKPDSSNLIEEMDDIEEARQLLEDL